MKRDIYLFCFIGIVTLIFIVVYSEFRQIKLPWGFNSTLYWELRSKFVNEGGIRKKNIKVTTIFPKDEHRLQSNTENKSHTDYKILFWSPVPEWLPSKINFSSCQYNKCRVSLKKKDINQSDAVLFHGPRHSKPIPLKRKLQVWIFMSFESPRNVGSFRHFNNKINWTWSYRRDSDIVRLIADIDVRSSKQKFNILPKKKPFAWFVSNCNDKSNRLKYMQMMKKYATVDVYGACGQLRCKNGNGQCLELLRSTYNFYLSFENSKCRDYITEKALVRIHNNIVPVTRGGANYSLYLPPHSYINTRWYKSVQAMTQAVLQSAYNESVYSKFHKWREFYINSHNLDLKKGWCEICKRLHLQNKYKRLYSDFQSWWNGNNETGYICSDTNDIR